MNLCILAAGVNVRQAASTSAPIRFTTSDARTFASVFGTASASDDSGYPWAELRFDDGTEGFVRADKLYRVAGDLSLLNAGKWDDWRSGAQVWPSTAAAPVQPPAIAPNAPQTSAGKWDAPLRGYTITTGFNALESDGSHHLGIDLAAPLGTPIYSRGNGVVYSADDCPVCPGGNGAVLGTSDPRSNYGFGVNVVVRFAYADLPGDARKALDAAGCTGGYAFIRFAHLSKRFVNAGATVGAGTLIGWLGSSGNSTGPHCHLEVRASLIASPANVFNEKLIDPAQVFVI